MSVRFLVFSGHNDRAVIALCRFFDAHGIGFVVAARGADDMIRHSRFADRVVIVRQDPSVNRALFEEIFEAAGGGPLVYCPTTEFINLFLLHNRSLFSDLPLIVPLPKASLYERLTNKGTAVELFRDVPGLTIPREYGVDDIRVPCVVKPKTNLSDGQILYPRICMQPEELADALAQCDMNNHMVQEYVSGDSLYLCGFLDGRGDAVSFWQRNLGQQTGGKSIVLAREETQVESALADLGVALLAQLRRVGFHGPFMIELRHNQIATYFIEINPRFWGPLQLALDVCPEILSRFIAPWFGELGDVRKRHSARLCYYSWKGGMQNMSWEPLAGDSEVETALAAVCDWDVFDRKDFDDFG